MTNKGSRRSAAIPTPAPAPVESAPASDSLVETETTVTEMKTVSAPESEVTQAVKEAVAAQQWLMQFTLNELYAVGITLPNSNMDSHVVLFNRNNGGQMPLADMHVSSNMTETDILRGAKRLVGAILNNLARSTALI